jgi:hypothetical protein
MTVIRSGPEAIKYMKARLGNTRFPPDNITVHHHCIGIAGRTATGRSAGYGTANAAARAVISAGKMKKGVGPAGSYQFWLDSDAGHVALNDYDEDYVLCNYGYSIGRPKRSYYNNLYSVGWCWAWEVPGWGPASAKIKQESYDAGKPKAPTVDKLPKVSLRKVHKAYKQAYNGKKSSAPGVKIVSNALKDLGFKGGNQSTNNIGIVHRSGKLGQFRDWEKSIGAKVADGIPNRKTLKKLAKKSKAFKMTLF